MTRTLFRPKKLVVKKINKQEKLKQTLLSTECVPRYAQVIWYIYKIPKRYSLQQSIRGAVGGGSLGARQ